MICVSISHNRPFEIHSIYDDCDMVELRLDQLRLTKNQLLIYCEDPVPVIATCRVDGMRQTHPKWSRLKAERESQKLLLQAIEYGVRYVDVEIEAPAEMMKAVRNAAHEQGASLIVSYHDFEGTKSREELERMIEKCWSAGADVVKIVTTANSQEDVDTVMSLYERYDENLVAFCMGKIGQESRIECLKRGAPWTYAAVDERSTTASGQYGRLKMDKKVYGPRFKRFFNIIYGPPSSKSMAQRAIICGALANGITALFRYSKCRDSEAALKVADALGAIVVRIDEEDGKETIGIQSNGAKKGSVNIKKLSVGESGLLTRLMIPIVAQISPSDVEISGEKTLLNRQLKGAKEALEKFGLSISDEKVPLKVSGNFSYDENISLSGEHGSQIISGLLMALALGEKDCNVSVSNPKSIPYLCMTSDIMHKFGIDIGMNLIGDMEFLESNCLSYDHCDEIEFEVKAGEGYKNAHIDLEGDWSAAANFFVGAAINGQITIGDLSLESVQADKVIIDVVANAGAGVCTMEGADGILIHKGPLTSFSVDATNCPDLIPILAVLAIYCHGTSLIYGVDRLVNKESDRRSAVVDMLSQMGVNCWVDTNALIVEGQTLARRHLTGNLIKGGNYTSHHDHRIAMALKVAEIGADSPIIIDDKACVAKSYPNFFKDWKRWTKK